MFVVVVALVVVAVIVVVVVPVIVVPVTEVSVAVVEVAVEDVAVVIVDVAVVVVVAVTVVVPISVNSTRTASYAVSMPTSDSATNGAAVVRIFARSSTSAAVVSARNTIVKISLCSKSGSTTAVPRSIAGKSAEAAATTTAAWI